MDLGGIVSSNRHCIWTNNSAGYDTHSLTGWHISPSYFHSSWWCWLLLLVAHINDEIYSSYYVDSHTHGLYSIPTSNHQTLATTTSGLRASSYAIRLNSYASCSRFTPHGLTKAEATLATNSLLGHTSHGRMTTYLYFTLQRIFSEFPIRC